MTLPVIMFPDTVLRPSVLAKISPLFKPVCLLAPPSLDQKAEPDADSGLVKVLHPAINQGADAAGDAEPKRMAMLLRQWEQWVRESQGTGLAEALKAGVMPETPETVRSVMGELKTYGQSKASARQTPEVTADLMLHLAHIHDTQAVEMENALSGYEKGREKLERSMGHMEDDHERADYEDAGLDDLPPLDYSQNIDHLLPSRLSAWATLAATLGDNEDWLITTHAQAIDILAARANAGLKDQPPELRSAAGVVAPFDDVPPEKGSDLVQLVAEIDLAKYADPGDGGASGLDPIRDGIEKMLNQLAEGPWGAEAVDNAAQAAAALAADFNALVAGSSEAGGQVALKIIAFPGLKRGDILGLMKDSQLSIPAEQRGGGAWPMIVIA